MTYPVFSAERAGSTVLEVNTAHVPMISKPKAVISLILEAAR